MKRWFSSFIGMILVCAITIAQTSISLLPKPQLCKDTGKNFTMGKVKTFYSGIEAGVGSFYHECGW